MELLGKDDLTAVITKDLGLDVETVGEVVARVLHELVERMREARILWIENVGVLTSPVPLTEVKVSFDTSVSREDAEDFSARFRQAVQDRERETEQTRAMLSRFQPSPSVSGQMSKIAPENQITLNEKQFIGLLSGNPVKTRFKKAGTCVMVHVPKYEILLTKNIFTTEIPCQDMVISIDHLTGEFAQVERVVKVARKSRTRKTFKAHDL